MDRDFFLNATPDRIPPVFGAGAHNRDRLLGRLPVDPNRPRLIHPDHYDPDQPVFRRHVWEVMNLTTGEVLASGRMPTQRLAMWAKHRAYCRVLAALTKARAES